MQDLNAQFLCTLKLAQNGSKLHQKLIYEEGLSTIQPIVSKYATYCQNYGLNRQDLMEVYATTMQKMLIDKATKIIKYESYLKGKYEYDVLSEIKRHKTKYLDQLRCAMRSSELINNLNDVENIYYELIKCQKDYFYSVLDLLNKKNSLTYEDVLVIKYLINGYKIGEIADIQKTSYYKVKKSLESTFSVLKDCEYLSGELLSC